MTTYYIVFEDMNGRVSSLWINSTTLRKAIEDIEKLISSEIRVIHYKPI